MTKFETEAEEGDVRMSTGKSLMLSGTIATAQAVFPTMRTGQIISNAVAWYNETQGVLTDIFYLEDAKLANIIAAYIKEFGGKL